MNEQKKDANAKTNYKYKQFANALLSSLMKSYRGLFGVKRHLL